MAAQPFPSPLETARLCTWSDTLHLRSHAPMQFLDLTDRIARCVRESGVDHGLVNIQCLHTSAALLVNENEPLLLEDFRALLERWAPRSSPWQHDRFDVRTVNMGPGERPNGHAHARALALSAAECLNVVEGRLELGRWQRIFFVECDGTRDRTVSVMVLGAGRRGHSAGTTPCA
jgi:secondary thiamine-phosphate synthase enzyme